MPGYNTDTSSYIINYNEENNNYITSNYSNRNVNDKIIKVVVTYHPLYDNANNNNNGDNINNLKENYNSNVNNNNNSDPNNSNNDNNEENNCTDHTSNYSNSKNNIAKYIVYCHAIKNLR